MLETTPADADCSQPEPLTPLTLFKALSDDTRLKIMLLVAAEEELCVCELTEALQQSQPKISRHLKLLRDLPLLADRRQGVWVYYRLHPELPEWAKAILQTTLDAGAPLTEEGLERLNNMGERPARRAGCC